MDPRRWSRPARHVALITVTATLLKVLYVVVAKWNDPLQLNDSYYYSLQAARNFQGHWWRDLLSEAPGAEHGPLTSLYLTPWSWASYPIPYQRLAIVALSAAVIPLIAVAGRRIGGDRVMLLSAVAAALYPNLWVNDLVVMSETLAIVLISATIVVTWGATAESTIWRWAALGGLCGLGALTRSELLLMAPVFAVVAWRIVGTRAEARRRLLAPLAILAACAVTVGPWVGYNLARYERPTLMTTNEGTTLLGANCHRSYYVDIGSSDISCLTFVDGEEPSVRSARQRSEAFRYAREHIGRVPVVVVARLGRSLDLYGLGSVVDLDLREEKIAWAVWLGVGAWWLLAVLAVVGWRDVAARQDRRRWWLIATPFCALLSTVLFYGGHRLRASAEPVVVVLAAVGLARLIDRPPRFLLRR